MKIEVFYSPGCRKCDAARESLRAAVDAVDPASEWRELNVLDELDYAVSLGVLTLPALAIDGELVFASLPTPQALTDALNVRRQTMDR